MTRTAASTGVTLRRIDVDRGMLAADVRTGKNPALLLLHGFAMNRSMWAEQIAGLIPNRRIIAVDLRGFGDSSPQRADSDHVADAIAVLDDMGCARADLLGLSLGANVALAVALARPEKVSRLVLASPGLPGHRWRTSRPPDEVAAIARSSGPAAARKSWLQHELFASVRDKPNQWHTVHAMIDRYDGQLWAGGPTAQPLPNLAARLPDVHQPTLIVNGELDLPGYLEIGERLDRELPTSRRVVLADAGHLSNLEQPKAFNKVVAAFLADPSPLSPEPAAAT